MKQIQGLLSGLERLQHPKGQSADMTNPPFCSVLPQVEKLAAFLLSFCTSWASPGKLTLNEMSQIQRLSPSLGDAPFPKVNSQDVICVFIFISNS